MITKCSMSQTNSFITAQQVVDILQIAFPGWGWMASVDDGVVYIKCSNLSERWGMQLKLNSLDKHQIIMMGGQLLERFGMPTGKVDKQALREARVDFTGAIESEKWTPDRRYYNKNEKRWKA